MTRKTVIYKIIDAQKREFVVRNRNTDDFPADFRHIYEALVNDKYLDHEIEAILSDLFNDDYFNLIALFDAPNEFNRDQKIINERKQRLTDKYICDDWTENPDLDKRVNNISYDINKYQKILNIRDLITLLNEKETYYQQRIAQIENDIEKANNDFDKKINNIQNQYDQRIYIIQREYNEKEKELQEKYDNMMSLLQSDYENEKIKLENVEKTCNELKQNADKYVNQQRAKYIELRDEINNKSQELNELVSEIKKTDNEIKALQSQKEVLMNINNEEKIKHMVEEEKKIKLHLIKTYDIKSLLSRLSRQEKEEIEKHLDEIKS